MTRQTHSLGESPFCCMLKQPFQLVEQIVVRNFKLVPMSFRLRLPFYANRLPGCEMARIEILLEQTLRIGSRPGRTGLVVRDKKVAMFSRSRKYE